MEGKKYSAEAGGKLFEIETHKIAKQADGAAFVTLGETSVLVTAVADKKGDPDKDFLPLTVNYSEPTYAAGKIPGGFFKREGRPSEKEILVSRMIDRPVRPLFTEGWNFETQVLATVMSADRINDATIPAILGASAALTISDVPFNGPVAGARVGRVDGKLILNPTTEERDTSDLDVVIVASGSSIVMVEGGANFLSESEIVDALMFGFEGVQPLIQLQLRMQKEIGKPKRVFVAPQPDARVVEFVNKHYRDAVAAAQRIREKHPRYEKYDALKAECKARIDAEIEPGLSKWVGPVMSEVKSDVVRKEILGGGKRIDGRGLRDVRKIDIELGLLKRTHGSALFQRGETQAIVTLTLGTSEDERKVETLEYNEYRKFYLHYNFPPYSVGEVRRTGSPGRREIGHGALAERALVATLPDWEGFPYTIRIVSEITESNGSSSMATVCGGSLAMMAGGVPVREPIAGIAMGLIQEGNKTAVLSDILGDEDHLGDMDFKVAGGASGITSFQMDIKIEGISRELLANALAQAHEGRMHILGEMAKAIVTPAADINANAPRVLTLRIPVAKIRDVIGPGGKVIRGIVEETGAKIDIEDDGTVRIYAASGASADAARNAVRGLTREAQVGDFYVGTVVKTVDFGAFIELFPGSDGLLHISEIEEGRVERVTDVLKQGDAVVVKVVSIDQNGRVRLSRREALHLTIEDVERMQNGG